MAVEVTTCQICARPIKLVRGHIAHHGYRRPWGAGSQTSPCDGTRHLPYEVACDALPPAIEAVGGFLAMQRALLDAWNSHPPLGITVPVRGWGRDYRPPDRSVLRPAGFRPGGYVGACGSYAYLHRARQANIAADIRSAQYELDRLRKRLADWRPAPGAARSAAHPEQTDA